MSKYFLNVILCFLFIHPLAASIDLFPDIIDDDERNGLFSYLIRPAIEIPTQPLNQLQALSNSMNHQVVQTNVYHPLNKRLYDTLHIHDFSMDDMTVVPSTIIRVGGKRIISEIMQKICKYENQILFQICYHMHLVYSQLMEKSDISYEDKLIFANDFTIELNRQNCRMPKNYKTLSEKLYFIAKQIEEMESIYIDRHSRNYFIKNVRKCASIFNFIYLKNRQKR